MDILTYVDILNTYDNSVVFTWHNLSLKGWLREVETCRTRRGLLGNVFYLLLFNDLPWC